MNNYMKIIISALKQWVNENLAAFDAKILNKVDAVDGKGLSTEDFTTEHKNKLDSITIPLSDSFIPDNIARIDDVNEVKELIGNIEIPEVNYPVTSVNGMTGDVVIEFTVNGAEPDENGDIKIEVGSDQIQADWEQNNSEQVDFIKNKPFYNTEPQYEAVFENVELVLTEDNENVNISDKGYITHILNSPKDEVMLKLDSRYKFVINSGDNTKEFFYKAESEIVTTDTGEKIEVVFIGNKDFIDTTSSNNKDPFILFTVDADILGYYLEATSIFYWPKICGIELNESYLNKTVSISLYKLVSEEKKIEPRYIVKSDWNENNTEAGGYIENKPFTLADTEEELIFDQVITIEAGEDSTSQALKLFDSEDKKEKYIVVWDNVRYECVPMYIEEYTTKAVLLGDFGFYDTSLQKIQNEKYPFCITGTEVQHSGVKINATGFTVEQSVSDDEEHTVQIYKVGKSWSFNENFSKEIQSDWEELNSESPKYIKNKPFYMENQPYVYVLSDKERTYDYPNPPAGYYWTIEEYDIEPIVGERYDVKINNRTYYQVECKIDSLTNTKYMGNLGILGNSEDTGENYLIAFGTRWEQDVFVNAIISSVEKDTSDSYVRGPGMVPIPIKEKFLPNIIKEIAKDFYQVKEKAMTQSDWLQQDENSIDFIKNKPEISNNKISLIDNGNGYKYDIYLYNGELIVAAAIDHIEVTTAPNTEYTYDETFDPTGMVVSAIYSDGKTEEIEGYTYAVGEGLGQVPVTISYNSLGMTYTTRLMVNFIHPDFELVNNEDKTVTVNSWYGTLNGETSTECVIPNNDGTFKFIV